MGFCRSRKPVPLSASTLALPTIVMLLGGGMGVYSISRIAAKVGSDTREMACLVEELLFEGIDAEFAPKVRVNIQDTKSGTSQFADAYLYNTKKAKLSATQEAAEAVLGYTKVGGAPKYGLFEPGKSPAIAKDPATGLTYGCFVSHNEDGSIGYVKLTRTRAPVVNDEYMLIAASVIFGAGTVYVIWMCVNHVHRTQLGREIGTVRVFAVGMNYTDCINKDEISELTGITDSDNFINMCEQAGVEDITYLTDQNYLLNAAAGMAPTKHTVIQTLNEIANRTSNDDMFIFFYAGHGDNVVDTDGDEDDGKDEAFVLMDQFGHGSESSYLVDDDFADALIEFPPGCRIMIVTDCCHSGTIADLDNAGKYGERAIVHFAGTQDAQEAADTGYGGAATTAMINAVNTLEQQKGAGNYTIGEVFQSMKKWMVNGGFTSARRVDPNLQDITLNFTGPVDPNKMPWPITKKGFIFKGHSNIDQTPLV
jgi:hypothetical protein